MRFCLRYSTPHCSKTSRRNAFTMIELLVMLAILSVLILLAIANFHKFIAQGYDARRKSDLAAYKIAFERFYDDHKCWPPADAISSCGSAALQPYLSKILCDPLTKKPYSYVPSDCASYKLYAKLDDLKDNDILSLGCTNGCGIDGDGDLKGDYNYGVGSSNIQVGGPNDTLIPGTCSISGGKKCYQNLCGACCPGELYRCDSSGLYCNYDIACRAPVLGGENP